MTKENINPEVKKKAERLMRMALDENKPRSVNDIQDAINLMNEVMVHALEFSPSLVVLAPTIRDCLKELLERREKDDDE